ncbi:hypothetical protein HMPREF0971_02969 [Segatella oris F0302]|uniref:Uncharacterized protein n=1 Tax=Segatella oris F0302 TaxID=649760 RepID=D1QVJ1_9BACT|nr:hypothetical protein HMPREF0971_02969 [Segatella oris F0302]
MLTHHPFHCFIHKKYVVWNTFAVANHSERGCKKKDADYKEK